MKLALVTAGYKRIGAAIAARLAADGWTLALHSRGPASPDPDLAIALHTHATIWHPFVADLGDEAAVATLLPAVIAHFGKVPQLIVNNASRFADDDAATLTAEQLSGYYAVNAIAPVMLTTALARNLAAGERACVINILDQRVRQPVSDQLGYTLSKQALWMATDTLARALAPHVRVNAVAPGLTLPTADYRPSQMAALEAEMPLALLPEPEDIADAVAWLAEARATTGQTLFVDGGANLKSFDRDFIFMGGV